MTQFNKLTTEQLEDIRRKCPWCKEVVIENDEFQREVYKAMQEAISVREWENLYYGQPTPPTKEEKPQE